MNWFKRLFNKEAEFEIVTHQVPMSTVCRWYLYDIGLVEDVNGMAELLGLNRISLEGEEMEREESDARMRNIEPLFPFLDSIADFSSQLLTTIHMKEIVDSNPDVDADDLSKKAGDMSSIYKAAALSSLIGGISAAVDLGLLHHDAVNTGVHNLGDGHEH